MPRRDPAQLARIRERKEAKKREKDAKASMAVTEQGRATLDIVLDGGKPAQPATNLPKAIKDFDAALDLKADNAEAFFLRGRCFQEQHEIEKAVADYAQCLTVNPEHIPALMQQAICFEQMADTDRAINNYTTVLEVDDRHDAAYNMRGCARLARRGGLGLKLRHIDFAAVESDFQSAVRCNENNYYAHCNLGRLYDEHHMFDKAVACYAKAMEVKDDYLYAAYRRGRSALTAVEEALRKAERALELDPTEVVFNESCAAVPFQTAAPRDSRKVEAPKGIPSTIFTLPPISKAKSAAAATSSSVAAGRITSAGASGKDNGGVIASESAFDKAAKLQVEREMAEEKQFAQLKQFLAQAIADFSRIVVHLEPEDRVKELPALLNRASCYLFDGDMEKAEEDVNFVRKSLDAYKELQPPPATTPDALKAALALIAARLETAKQKRRHGQPISPFASGAQTLAQALRK